MIVSFSQMKPLGDKENLVELVRDKHKNHFISYLIRADAILLFYQKINDQNYKVDGA